MTENTFEMNPVEAITADAVGEPGQRVFYIQARTAEATVTLVVEKAQVQMLAHGIYQLLAEVSDRYGVENQHATVDSLDLEIQFPLEPDFRVARLELAYDSLTDLVALVAHELVAEDPEAEPGSRVEGRESSSTPAVARLYAARHQMHAMADRALEVAARGRPICPLCGQSYGDQGHVCPRRNGHPSGG